MNKVRKYLGNIGTLSMHNGLYPVIEVITAQVGNDIRHLCVFAEPDEIHRRIKNMEEARRISIETFGSRLLKRKPHPLSLDREYVGIDPMSFVQETPEDAMAAWAFSGY